MKNRPTILIEPSSRVVAAMLAVALVFASFACRGNQDAVSPPSSNASIVDITVRDLTFEAPSEVPSGWTTIRLKNTSGMTHFGVLERLPDGRGLADQQREIAPVFQAGMDLFIEGKTDEAMTAFDALPAWFGDVVFMGGPGLIAPWQTAEVTVMLEPGTYLIECYVKTVGVFHSYNPSPELYGMVHELTVTDEPSGAPEPVADLDVTISSARGIEVVGDVGLGRHEVAVHFEDQMAYENFLGHDIHLARLNENTDLDALSAWMDWRQPHGLETPAPAEFLGGLHEMPAGQTGYFAIDLEPGTYAWIAEVPDPAEKMMLKTFSTSVR